MPKVGDDKVLLVEDNARIASDFVSELQEEGRTPLLANNCERACEIVKANPDLTMVVVDLNTHGSGNLRFIQYLSSHTHVRLVVTSGAPDFWIRAIEDCPTMLDDVIVVFKPFSLYTIDCAIRDHLKENPAHPEMVEAPALECA